MKNEAFRVAMNSFHFVSPAQVFQVSLAISGATHELAFLFGVEISRLFECK